MTRSCEFAAVLACSVAAVLAACSSPADSASTAADAAAEVSFADVAGKADAGADATSDTTASDVPDAAEVAAQPDVGPDAGAADGTDAGATDVAVADSPDSAAVDAADVAAPDATVETSVPDAVVPDAVGPDATAPDAAADAGSDTGDDASETDIPPTPDVTAPDAGPACKAGELDRCWIECVQPYATGCIHADLPPRILGTRACTAGQWGACEAQETCAPYTQGPCTNGSKLPAKYLCTDGKQQTGAILCSKPLGAQCNLSYYINWPIIDCPMICTGPNDVCSTAGAERDCVVHCGSATGPEEEGKQTCQEVCGTKIWSACFTGDACLKGTGGP